MLISDTVTFCVTSALLSQLIILGYETVYIHEM